MKKLFLILFPLVCLMITTTTIASNYLHNQQTEVIANNNEKDNMKKYNSFSDQETTINLNSANLRQPCLLTISTSGNQVNGEIIIDGKSIKKIKNESREEINLSPYLSIGTHHIEIIANYSPHSSLISLEFAASETQVSQQTSGNGFLKHNLIIRVEA